MKCLALPLAIGNPSMVGAMLCQVVSHMLVAYVDLEIADRSCRIKVSASRISRFRCPGEVEHMNVMGIFCGCNEQLVMFHTTFTCKLQGCLGRYDLQASSFLLV